MCGAIAPNNVKFGWYKTPF